MHRCWFLCSLFLVACGGDLTGLQGVYNIDTWTRNDTACGAEGASILETQGSTALYIKAETFITEKFVNVVPCADTADCEEMAGDDTTIYLGNWIFQDGSDDDGWQSVTYSAFDNFDDDTQCDGTRREAAMTTPAEGGLRIEARTNETIQFAKPSGVTNCFLDIDDAELEDLVGEQACVRLEVLTATFLSGL